MSAAERLDIGTTELAGADSMALRFRSTPRRRRRLAAGLALGAIAIAGNVFAYTSLGSAEPVIQAVRDIPAGEQITLDDFRAVEVEVVGDVNVVTDDQLTAFVGSYAKVRIVSGSLLVAQALQPTPLVEPGRAVVAVLVEPGELPIGLRERVQVQVVIPGRANGDSTTVYDAVTIGLPTATDSTFGVLSQSLEVAAGDAASVAAADRVRIVLVEPDVAVDPAGTGEDGG